MPYNGINVVKDILPKRVKSIDLFAQLVLEKKTSFQC